MLHQTCAALWYTRNMNTDEIAQQAMIERTLAYWTDPANFPVCRDAYDIEFERIISCL